MSGTFDLAEWRSFCSTAVRADARRADSERELSPSIWAGIRERRFLELFHALPGGTTTGAQDEHLLFSAMVSLAEACASTFWRATISSALCGRMISELGTEALRARWIGCLASGEAVGCFAVTERGSGSDPASYRASLRKRGASWFLHGKKTRVSNAPVADVAAVLCPAWSESGEALGLALAVTELASKRVRRERHSSLGLRAMGWGALAFDDLEVAEDSIVLGATMPRTLKVVEWGQVIQAVCGLGLGTAALRDAEAFTGGRVSFGRPLSRNGVVRSHLDSARLELDAAELLVREVVAAKGRGEVGGERVLMAKIFTTEAGVRACEAALRVCGGWGYSTELEVERYLRDALGNVPSGLPNDRLRELLMASRLGTNPWAIDPE